MQRFVGIQRLRQRVDEQAFIGDEGRRSGSGGARQGNADGFNQMKMRIAPNTADD